MILFRAFFLRHRTTAMAVIALALAMKALIPTGMMIGSDARTLTVQICDGYADAAHAEARAVVIAIKHHNPAEKAAPDHQACPYSALGHAGLAGADPALLTALLAFIVLVGIAGFTVVTVRLLPRLRPPLRAPPVPA